MDALNTQQTKQPQPQQRTEVSDDLVVRILLALKRSILLIIAIIVVATMAGTIYSYTRPVVYTSTYRVIYKAERLRSETSTEGVQAKDTTMTNMYFETVVGFCTIGNVVDRANYYYHEYLDYAKSVEDPKIETFIDDIKDGNVPYDYQAHKEEIKGYNYIKMSSIGVNNPDGYAIDISYTDDLRDAANVKSKITVVAIQQEAMRESDEPPASPTDPRSTYYFGKTKIMFIDAGDMGVSASSGSTRIVILSALVGVVAALLVVYLLNVLNRTVTTEEEIERITGSSLLCYISNKGGEH